MPFFFSFLGETNISELYNKAKFRKSFLSFQKFCFWCFCTVFSNMMTGFSVTSWSFPSPTLIWIFSLVHLCPAQFWLHFASLLPRVGPCPRRKPLQISFASDWHLDAPCPPGLLTAGPSTDTYWRGPTASVRCCLRSVICGVHSMHVGSFEVCWSFIKHCCHAPPTLPPLPTGL